MEAIRFPGVEKALAEWLPAALAVHGLTHSVSTEIPNPRPAQFVRVQRTGGPRQNLVVDGAQVTFEVWDVDAPAAEDSAAVVRAVVGSARNLRTPSGALIYGVTEFSGPALLPDRSGHARYSWTAQIRLRGTAL